jgi:uncharacterized DUF497 family protein
MESRYTWIEIKRAKNLDKQSFAFVFERLAALTVVHLPGEQPHIISFRPASRVEREIYHEWFEHEFDGR